MQAGTVQPDPHGKTRTRHGSYPEDVHLPTVDQVPLAEFTTLGVGGSATRLLRAASAEELHTQIGRSPAATVPVVLGGGSNVVIHDSGLSGPVIVYRSDVGQPRHLSPEVVWFDGALVLDRAVDLCIASRLAGIESLSGVPGTIGAAVVQNVGAYGVELAEFIEFVDVLDLRSGESHRLDADGCHFGYRTSRFKADPLGGAMVTGVALRLRPDGRHIPRYRELADYLSPRFDVANGVPIGAVRQAVRELRRRKGMLYVEEDTRTWSAGSFFVNPVVDGDRLPQIRESAGCGPDDIPTWPAAEGRTKLAAAWLVERAGFPRGTRRGHVRISPLHALALTNWDGRASAADIVAAACEIVEAVHDTVGIRLKAEVKFLGFDREELGVLAEEAAIPDAGR